MRVPLLICILLGVLSASCGAPPAPPVPPLPEPSQILGAAGELQKLVAADPELKRLLEKAIEEGRKLNPDPETNPAQTLEQYYQFVRFAEGATPANLIKHAPDATLYKRIDQSLGYLYFISDIPLDELKGRGYFNNSLQYVDSYNSWLQGFVKSWGLYLDQPESWNAGMLQLAQEDPVFGLKRGWYESPDNWKSFNQFFARRLASPDKRPIAAPDDDAVFVSPVDAVPMGTWSVGDDLKLVATEGVAVKTATVESVAALLDGSPYASAFAGGTFTHLFLDVGDYHRHDLGITRDSGPRAVGWIHHLGCRQPALQFRSFFGGLAVTGNTWTHRAADRQVRPGGADAHRHVAGQFDQLRETTGGRSQGEEGRPDGSLSLRRIGFHRRVPEGREGHAGNTEERIGQGLPARADGRARGAPGWRATVEALQVPGFCTQTLHQPAPSTSLPGNRLHTACLSVALPWNCRQLAHFCVTLCSGLALASTLVVSVM